MARLDAYKNSFQHANLSRSTDGVLEVVLHTNGGTLIFNGCTHEEFVELFHQIVRMQRIALSSLPAPAKLSSIASIPRASIFFTPLGYDKIYREGKKILSNLLEIPVSVIAALNGPATVQSEYVLLAGSTFVLTQQIIGADEACAHVPQRQILVIA